MQLKNFIKIYEKSFIENWELPALTDYPTGRTLNYSDVAREIALSHVLFESLGIHRGSKIALCGKDTSAWVVAYMAAVTYGAVIVPILSEFNPVDITHIVNHSEAEILFISESIWEHIEPERLLTVKGVFSIDNKKILHEGTGLELARAVRLLKRRFNRRYPDGFTSECISYPDRDNSEVVEINYTSGTTGFSKGVMLTGENLAGNVCFGMSSELHFRSSRALSFLPLAHAYGCAFDMLTPLAVGSHITLLCKTPSPRVLIKALADVRPHLVICVPLILEKIYKSQILPLISKGTMRWTLAVPFLDSLIYAKIRKKLIEAFGGEFEEVIVGGAPLNHEVEDFLHKIKFPFTVGYGMTECGPLISYTPWRKFIPGSSGRVLPGMEAKILSSDPKSVPGEICVRGTNVMKGYFKNPEATEAVLDKEGWLHTGDMGTLSDDCTLFIRGRSKTMILSANGQNIYPEEIEAKLNNMPFVAESLVVERDGRLVGLVYPDYDALDRLGIRSSELPSQLETIRVELNKLVAPYERLAEIRAIPNEFEKTPKRSIKRFLYTTDPIQK
ncbi:MAG: long-chain fatty acid--CoA ligase [Bacteroidales bacterium]|nr:long-chain fatty acid--CoA ligase [Bacteroidales bacterium]MBD5222109.1 long-chain fatty acid--CoA ligase [Bacteroidales bacterium]